ncbi:hypothetical protein GCM10011492_35720 [Flexivirga endophytica]|uniref:Glycosyl hydrolase family 99 n=1 Tax=Flexivirga endophytica TaxID=1849103 RepID=A0A916WY66_9MICO|nr:hypothetical protein [Flexivirga endophytica]GGB41634.1 hypothetical protein GCM10011492_35720 [Flexivirga endophytica]GHB49477.1 hypothetical protein GCM10008112_18100 [Flexivirga endophytica]
MTFLRTVRATAPTRARGILVVLAAAVFLTFPPATAAASIPAGRETVPVYAYFYQWFNRTSWNRAKVDHPIAGDYSSDDRAVLQRQIAQAQSAGLSGFLTSWKSTPVLNRRLQMLLDEAGPRHFDIGVVYEALDFQGRPLPVATVRHDMVELVDRWGPQLDSRRFGRPVIIWTGTQHYSVADVRGVRTALGGRADLLASAKSAAEYQRLAPYVDGDAYYWSSANPGTTYTRGRLDALAAVVHEHHGIWLAPALAGFDGRTLGHTRTVPRDQGQTLIRSLQDSFASRPDAVGLISWNEWSENTYIEPGHRYGRQELDALAGYLPHRHDASPATSTERLRSPPWTGMQAAGTLTAATLVLGGLVIHRSRVRRRQ